MGKSTHDHPKDGVEISEPEATAKQTVNVLTQASSSGQKRDNSGLSSPKAQSGTTKKKKQKKARVDLAVASSTIQNMSVLLNNSVTKITELEDEVEDNAYDIVRELKKNLKDLNRQNEILILYAQQHLPKST